MESHRALFARALRGTRIANDILDIRFYGPDTAVLTSSGDTYKGGRPERLSKVQTYTIVRRPDGAWRIAAFQNTKRRPLLEELSFRLAPAARPGSGAPVTAGRPVGGRGAPGVAVWPGGTRRRPVGWPEPRRHFDGP